MVVASNYHDIHEMELRSHCLNSLKDIVFKRYSQVSHFTGTSKDESCFYFRPSPHPLAGGNSPLSRDHQVTVVLNY